MIDVNGQSSYLTLKRDFSNIEDLKIKIYSNKKDINEDYENPINTTNKKSDFFFVLVCLFIAIPFVLLFIILFILFICIKKKLNNRQTIRNNLNRNEIRNDININQENENKRKIELLFNKLFYPIKYSQELFKNNNTNCSICLENYIKLKSLLCLTLCNHIFH